MRGVTVYACARIGFGMAALVAPAIVGKSMTGLGGATPAAGVFVRGMGAREVGIGLSVLGAERNRSSIRPNLLAGLITDGGDVAAIIIAWRQLPPVERALGLALAVGAGTVGAALLAVTPGSEHRPVSVPR
ncbi:hypothetical protein [Mycolicibacterium fluoranthenivorans]|uniref:DUF4267 domain-containing protein n=1 Tax=Mycolicibacterium fluoranthenivorans TaxID=258505 RepID=A0A7X5TZR1_9MYCO|nr:hypothetical protein [Mycolicibacterium fluoranthenivorans]MCV7358114.1 hypothetical protein [Mycolicibacterium fluoranthenivorans]NIH95766.1 hypothetical protein [Mycolicibacterium fluoranthenivorans]